MVDREGKQVLLCTWSRRSPTLDFDFQYLDDPQDSEEPQQVLKEPSGGGVLGLEILTDSKFMWTNLEQLVENLWIFCTANNCVDYWCLLSALNPQLGATLPIVYFM